MSMCAGGTLRSKSYASTIREPVYRAAVPRVVALVAAPPAAGIGQSVPYALDAAVVQVAGGKASIVNFGSCVSPAVT
jgi:hypothetical protein